MVGDAPEEYTPTVFEQVMAAAAKAETAAANLLELRDSGALTGPAGPRGRPGEDGRDGRTPVKGTDYFTETDRQELVDAVLQALPAAEEASF